MTVRQGAVTQNRRKSNSSASESQLRAIISTVTDGVIVMDADQNVIVFNPACERLFGYDAEEVVGSDVSRLISYPKGDARAGHVDYGVLALQRSSSGIGQEVVGRRKTGDTFPVELSIGEARAEGDRFFVGVLRDLTDRKLAEKFRRKLFEQLTPTHEEQVNFTFVASHDLREPLRMVSAYCGLISKDYGARLDERGREFLQLATSATVHMKDLLDDLVDLGRLGYEGGRSVWFDADAGLDEALEYLHGEILDSGAAITRTKLPKIYANPMRFERVLQNLIANALKYVAPGVRPQIKVSGARDGEFWRFSVTDNGIGIEERHFDRIFEPFKRLHGKSTYGGSGLGLAICRKIVEDFGGEISLRSSPGSGSTFSFTVRARMEDPVDD
jgi:PAS domain S-box-containing protein